MKMRPRQLASLGPLFFWSRVGGNATLSRVAPVACGASGRAKRIARLLKQARQESNLQLPVLENAQPSAGKAKGKERMPYATWAKHMTRHRALVYLKGRRYRFSCQTDDKTNAREYAHQRARELNVGAKKKGAPADADGGCVTSTLSSFS